MFRRGSQIAAVCVFSLTMLGAGTSSTRTEKIGHKLVCQCGCGQILMECNHVGCPVSPVMIAELHTQVDSGIPEAGVLKFFIAKYGPIVLAAPMRGGFDNVAWIVPIAALVLCFTGIFLLMRTWKRRSQLVPAAETPTPAGADPIHDRIRRDTDYDNWSSQ